MSDRLKADLYTIWDRGRHGISWEESWVQDFLDDVAPVLVSAVRAGAESGEVEGKIVDAVDKMDRLGWGEDWVVEVDGPGTYLVMEVNHE